MKLFVFERQLFVFEVYFGGPDTFFFVGNIVLFFLSVRIASFIFIFQLALPENHHRTTNNMFEEISIPASEPIKLKVEPTLVEIDSLDEVRNAAVFI